LIKTKTYYAVKKKSEEEQDDNFLEGFGLAAKVASKDEAADLLRESNWTGNPKC
jgi:hypothetical protein